MFDRENMFSYAQAVAATADSTDIVFTGKGDAGSGQPKFITVVSPKATGTGTITVNLLHSTTATGTYANILAIAVSNAILVRGSTITTFAIPEGIGDYLKLNYTFTGTLTGFTPTAGIVTGGQSNFMR